MKFTGSFIRRTWVAAGVLAVSNPVVAAMPEAKGTEQEQQSIVWMCLAGFIIATLAVSFWNSKRAEAD